MSNRPTRRGRDLRLPQQIRRELDIGACDSIVRPPRKPRTTEQLRMYRTPIAKNISRPFRRNGRAHIV